MREKKLHVYLCYSFCKNRYFTHFFSHSGGYKEGEDAATKESHTGKLFMPFTRYTHTHTPTHPHTSSHTNQIHCPNNSGKYVRGGAVDFSHPPLRSA